MIRIFSNINKHKKFITFTSFNCCVNSGLKFSSMKTSSCSAWFFTGTFTSFPLLLLVATRLLLTTNSLFFSVPFKFESCWSSELLFFDWSTSLKSTCSTLRVCKLLWKLINKQFNYNLFLNEYDFVFPSTKNTFL